MSSGVVVKDTDHGYRALVDRIYGLRNPQIEVGILEAEGSEQHKGDDEGTTVADVANWMEFGFHHVEGNYEVLPRSFVRAWADANEKEIRELIFRVMKSVVAGELDKEEALERIGLWAAAGMQKFIADDKVRPELAQSTIDRKHSSVPLIHTGQLRGAISFRVLG
jgi:hypothetical protein